ncbi:hypothetical protein PIB30_008566 [Stylosanthes scabra]|uniref:Pentatricopeptide repeat-containing protein n=1 Tax=Stylosanthes scabra TaxID=79078 RepID=A0ABU6Q4Z5_9FABA|nr:hypothetical protein [Stylosanthes scabra]
MMIWRSPRFSHLVARLTQLHAKHASHRYCNLSRFHPSQLQAISDPCPQQEPTHTDAPNHYIGRNVSRKDKNNYLLSTLLDLNDTKEAVYGALDAWVAWEQNFPIASLKLILNTLEKQQQWHRVVQVIKWMLSKGQGNTMGTYGQLIRALDMDHRVEEAHKFWQTKIGTDLHSVPWQLCHLMISVYYRNNMLEDLVRLFKGLEAFDRKPRDKTIIRKVANAYEMLDLHQEKERVLEKYSNLFTEEGSIKKARRSSSQAKKGIPLLTEKGKQESSIKATSDKD